MNDYGAPGPGGSLGKCALCGENFLAAIVLGSSVKTFTVTGCASTLYAHDKCVEKYAGSFEVTKLPDKSPLRQAYEQATAEPEPRDMDTPIRIDQDRHDLEEYREREAL